jgi:hypothetical protein
MRTPPVPHQSPHALQVSVQVPISQTSDLFKTGSLRARETTDMSTQSFTPALGRFAPARFFDPVVALTRERLWRALAAMYVAPQPDAVIVDVGCGTGSLALLLGREEPRARIVGLDPDPEVLAVARRKSDAAQAAVQWCVSMGDALVESLGAKLRGHRRVRPGAPPVPAADEAGSARVDQRGAATRREAGDRRLRRSARGRGGADGQRLDLGLCCAQVLTAQNRQHDRGRQPHHLPHLTGEVRLVGASASDWAACSASAARRSRVQTRQRASGMPN